MKRGLEWLTRIYQLISGKHAGERHGDSSCLEHAEVEGNPVSRIHGTEADVFARLNAPF